MSAITTHILDTARGRPAANVPVSLSFKKSESEWILIGQGNTDADGRLRTLVPAEQRPSVGTYRITFDTGAYFASIGIEGFYPEATIAFEVRSASEHYHVPLLLQPFGYSTYRGS